MHTESHGLAPSSYESVNRLRLTRLSHVYSRYSSPDSDCSLVRWRKNRLFTNIAGLKRFSIISAAVVLDWG